METKKTPGRYARIIEELRKQEVSEEVIEKAVNSR